MSCLFCDIVSKKIDSDIIYQDEEILAFSDVNPQAPQHKLIIPRKHIASINELQPDDTPLIGHMFQMAKQLARELHVADDGYRLVFNINQAGGQEVYHLHLHLLAGRQMHWPPG